MDKEREPEAPQSEDDPEVEGQLLKEALGTGAAAAALFAASPASARPIPIEPEAPSAMVVADGWETTAKAKAGKKAKGKKSTPTPAQKPPLDPEQQGRS